MQDINFLRQQNQFLTKQTKRDKTIFTYVALATVLVILASGSVFGINFLYQRKVQAVSQKLDSTEKKIRQKKPLETDYIFFINKLKIIRELFEVRSDKQVAISFFTELFGPGVQISGINYQLEEGILSLTVTSDHVFALESAFETLADSNVTSKFKSVSKSSLTRSEDGKYNFKLTVSFAQDSDLIKEVKPTPGIGQRGANRGVENE
jgi:hypothetical protein